MVQGAENSRELQREGSFERKSFDVMKRIRAIAGIWGGEGLPNGNLGYEADIQTRQLPERICQGRAETELSVDNASPLKPFYIPAKKPGVASKKGQTLAENHNREKILDLKPSDDVW